MTSDQPAVSDDQQRVPRWLRALRTAAQLVWLVVQIVTRLVGA